PGAIGGHQEGQPAFLLRGRHVPEPQGDHAPAEMEARLGGELAHGVAEVRNEGVAGRIPLLVDLQEVLPRPLAERRTPGSEHAAGVSCSGSYVTMPPW